jgi:hypothetical protein
MSTKIRDNGITNTSNHDLRWTRQLTTFANAELGLSLEPSVIMIHDYAELLDLRHMTT